MWTADANTAALQAILYSTSVAQLCLILCDPVDCSPPGPSVHGIFQARILEWVSISFPRAKTPQRSPTTDWKEEADCWLALRGCGDAGHRGVDVRKWGQEVWTCFV